MLNFVILAFATWRLSSLAAREQGPFGILDKLRYWAGVRYDAQSQPFGNNEFAKMLLCPWCNSVWIGLVVTILYFVWPAITWLCLPLALSAVAIVLDSKT